MNVIKFLTFSPASYYYIFFVYLVRKIMSGSGAIFFAQSEHVNIVLLVGVTIFLGIVGARVFKRFHIPQIIGFVTIGIILGPVVKFISVEDINQFEYFNEVALGIIGFLIGSELKKEIFEKFGKQVFSILFFEGLTACLLVTLLSFGVASFWFEWHKALAIAVVFGAICAATDPASTVNVLWEYKSRGPLTTLLTAIVALDDALALLLYIVSISLAGILTGHQQEGLLQISLFSLYEVSGSLVLGVLAAYILKFILKFLDDIDIILVFSLSSVILTIGIAKTIHLDVILSTMAFGMALINFEPDKSKKCFELVKKFSPPIYVLFFVLIGARLDFQNINGLILFLACAYIGGSVVGKTFGAYLGSVYSKASPTVRKYLGFSLYQQGTIAIALMMMASRKFDGEIRDLMVSVIVIGVFVLQLCGPLFVKMAVKKAGEMGLNITEEDLIKGYSVLDAMDTQVPCMDAGTPLCKVISIVSQTDSYFYPVLDDQGSMIGCVTIEGIRRTFETTELNDWLVALDIMEEIEHRLRDDMSLGDAFEMLTTLNIDQLPVTAVSDENKFLGVIDLPRIKRRLSAEVLAKQKEADAMYVSG